MLINKIDRSLHYIRETEQGGFLRRHLKRDIFTYYQPKEDVWVICEWARKDKGLFQELLILKRLQHLSHQEVARLEKWAAGKTPSLKDLADYHRKKSQDESKKRMEDDEEARRVKKWVGKRLGRKFGHIVADDPEWDIPGFSTQPRKKVS